MTSANGKAACERRALAALLVLAMLGGVPSACTHAPVRKPTPTAVLRVQCNIPRASLWVDDKPIGLVSGWKNGGPIPAGFRRITVRHPDYYPFYAEVTLAEKEKADLDVVLYRILE